MQSSKINEMPAGMERGSSGHLFNMILALLHGWNRGIGIQQGIVLDGKWEGCGIGALTQFQLARNLPGTGKLDEPTRKEFESYFGVTLDDLAIPYPGAHEFIQEDGRGILWSHDV